LDSLQKPLFYHRYALYSCGKLGGYAHQGGLVLARKFATGIAIIALSLSLTGCSFTGNVASLQPYTPGDGQQVDLESVKARNFMYLVSDSGRGFLIGSLVSASTQDVTVKLQYINEDTSERSDFFFDVPAGSKIDFGFNGNLPIDVPVIEVPGQTAKFYLLESDKINGSMQVPVLDGTLSEYRELIRQLEENRPEEIEQ
jgi:hypothetical protein